VISGFRHQVDKNCALLGYYAASSGNLLPTFQENSIGPETSVRNYHYSPNNNPEQSSSYLPRGQSLKSRIFLRQFNNTLSIAEIIQGRKGRWSLHYSGVQSWH